jgi:hypothetical protein
MIFGGLTMYASKAHAKHERQAAYAVKSGVPMYLQWSEATITFDWAKPPPLPMVSQPQEYTHW